MKLSTIDKYKKPTTDAISRLINKNQVNEIYLSKKSKQNNAKQYTQDPTNLRTDKSHTNEHNDLQLTESIQKFSTYNLSKSLGNENKLVKTNKINSNIAPKNKTSNSKIISIKLSSINNTINEHNSTANIFNRTTTTTAQTKQYKTKCQIKNSLKENRNVTKCQPKQEINNTRHNKSQHNNDPTTNTSRLQWKAKTSDETTVIMMSKIQQNKKCLKFQAHKTKNRLNDQIPPNTGINLSRKQNNALVITYL